MTLLVCQFINENVPIICPRNDFLRSLYGMCFKVTEFIVYLVLSAGE